MTDAHYHRDGATLMSICGEERRFFGVHPWSAEEVDAAEAADGVRRRLAADALAGVGEVGLDRLRSDRVTPAQRGLLLAQLAVAAEMRRPVVLHGARCWGEVVGLVRPFAGMIPSMLFHGFSRSGGLLEEMFRMNAFVGVGKAVLNDHAVNYRELVRGLPPDRLLVETDCDGDGAEARGALLARIFAKVSELTGATEAQLDANARRFAGA